MTKHLNAFFLANLVISSAFASEDAQKTILRERQEVSIEKKRELPKNLARWHMGTTLIETQDNGQNPSTEWALPSGPQQDIGKFLSDDETESVFLEEGRNAFIINLQAPELIDRFFTKSFGGAAKIQLLGSSTLQEISSDAWTSLGRKQTLSAKGDLEIRFAATEIQYIAIVFEVTQPGDFGNLSFTGELNLAQTRLPSRLENQNYAQRTEELDDTFSYDFATTYSGSSIPFSTDEATQEEVENIIDDDFQTYYDMDTQGESSAMIIDLNESTFINKVSLLFEAQSGTVEFYFLDRLPGEEEGESTAFYDSEGNPSPVFVKEYWLDGLNRPILLAQTTRMVEVAQNTDTQMREITLSEDFFDNIDARYVEQITEGQERLSIPINNQTSRYVLLRWIPNNSGGGAGMRIYELSVFGPMPSDEPLVERGLDFDEQAPAAGGDIAAGANGNEPGSPDNPASPPGQPTAQEPLIPTVNAVSQ